MNDKQIQVRFPEAIWKRLKESAKYNRRSFNAEVIWALEQYVGREEASNEEEKGPEPRGQTEKPDQGV